jgi:hypothetical protein
MPTHFPKQQRTTPHTVQFNFFLQAHGRLVSLVLYQPYTYPMPTDTTEFLRRMHEVATDPALAGYRQLTWGICTTGACWPRAK